MTATALQAPTVRINGSGGDVIIVRSTGRVTILNGCDADEIEEYAEKGRMIIKGDPATEIVRTDGDVEIDGDVNDVVVVEGEAVIVNATEDDDDDDDDDDDEDEDDE